MLKRPSIFVLFWILFCTSAWGQESDVLLDRVSLHSGANPSLAGAEPVLEFHVSGTLISPSGRLAIVNGKPSREGDRVDGVEILSIDPGTVRIHTGSRELTVHLGPKAARVRSSVSREVIRSPSAPERPAGSVRSEVHTVVRVDTHDYHGPVKRGETLSGIAQHHISDGVTINQMMIALFRANPHAFSDNINVLYEGAVLRIPDGDELRSQPPGTATAEVVRQTDAWRTGSRQQARLTMVPARDSAEPRSMYERPGALDALRAGV